MNRVIAGICLLAAAWVAGPGPLHAVSVEVTKTEAKTTLGQAVRAFDFVCPRVSIAFARGPGPRGDVFKVFCGPPGGGTYARLVYRVVITPDNRFLVVPWE